MHKYIYGCSVLTFFSHLNISLVQISSILEGFGLVVLVVDQLSPHKDLAPMQDCFCLFHFSTLSYTHTHTHTQRSQEKCILMLIEVSIADGHELYTTYIGNLKTMEGTNAVKTNARFKSSTVGSRVMQLHRQQTPLSAKCSNRRGRKVKAVTALSFLSQTSISIFSVQ